MQTSTDNRIDWLDALRGWAVLGVVCVHSGGVTQSGGILGRITSAGQYGVQLFFIVSALTISITYQAHLKRYGETARSQFAWFIKRFFRIAPLYYLAAIFYPILAYMIFIESHHEYGGVISAWDIIANVLFIHEWVPSANNSVVPGGWSIGVEMCFYATVPLIWRIRSKRRRVILLLSAIPAGICTSLVAASFASGSFYIPDNSFFYFWFPAEAPVIIVGLILFLSRGTKLTFAAGARGSIGSFLGFAALSCLGFYLGPGRQAAPILAPVVMAASFVLLILGLDGPHKVLIVNRVSIYLGKISFSVYIIHFAVLTFIHAAFHRLHLIRSGLLPLLVVILTTIVITMVLASLSKRMIEDPFIKLGHRIALSIALHGATTSHQRESSICAPAAKAEQDITRAN